MLRWRIFFSADEEGALSSAEAADACAKAAAAQANIADIHMRDANARGDFAEAAVAREKVELALTEAREKHEKESGKKLLKRGKMLLLCERELMITNEKLVKHALMFLKRG